MKLVCGVGINDAEYTVQIRETVAYKENGSRIRKLVWSCPFHSRWSSMISRCYGKHNNHDLQYEDCSVSDEWLRFSVFKNWMEKEDWKGKELDKDLLLKGNKVYGPDTCIFVDRSVNIFMTDRASKRGRYPLGVCKNGKRYSAYCNQLDGFQKYLGSFITPEEAHEVWKNEKYRLALILASLQTDKRISISLIERYKNETQI